MWDHVLLVSHTTITIKLSSTQSWLSQLLLFSSSSRQIRVSYTLAMKKNSKENDLGQQQQNLDPENPQSSRFSGRSCSSALSRLFGLRCLIVLLISLAILLSAIFCLFPRRSVSEVDAGDTVKLNGKRLSTKS